MEEMAHNRISEVLGQFLRDRERVLILLPREEPGAFSAALAGAVRQRGGIPEFLGEDLRWKTLLKVAFSKRYTAVVGDPAVILGLRKVAKATLTPLFIRNAVLTEPTSQKIREDLGRGLDCHIWDLTQGHDHQVDQLTRQLLPWSSILDYKAIKTEYGLDLEVVVFPGEKLPWLPSCAKLRIRNWDPETDIPFSMKT